jgi:hypothetical protein
MSERRAGLDRLRLLTDWGLALAAVAIASVLVLRAAVSIDSSTDTWWYHLPWAARLGGLLPAERFVFSELLEQRYAGFPVLVEWLQGQLWRLTGRAEAAGFVSLGALGLFVVFLRLRFRVPPQLAFIALIAVPLIQIHATAYHTDLPANLALTAALLLLVPLFAPAGASRRGDLALFVLACGLAAHSKPQLIPAAAAVFAAGLGALALGRLRNPGRGPLIGAGSLAWALGIVLATGAVFSVPLKNAVRFGNPFYPIAVRLGPIALDGPETGYISHDRRLAMLAEYRQAAARATPQRRAKKAAARPVAVAAAPPPPPLDLGAKPSAWAASALELGMEPVLGKGLWNLLSAQDPPLPPRYGGYFGWYMVLHLALLAGLVVARPRSGAVPLALFAGATAAAALLPSSDILRYYLFWPILLVSQNLILLRAAAPASPASERGDWERLVGLMALGAFLLTVYATRAEFFQPRFYSLEDLIERRRDPAVLARVESHPSACLAGERPPRAFLYTELFNPGKTYRLKTGPEAGHGRDEIPATCGAGWTPTVAERDDAGLIPSARGP